MVSEAFVFHRKCIRLYRNAFSLVQKCNSLVVCSGDMFLNIQTVSGPPVAKQCPATPEVILICHLYYPPIQQQRDILYMYIGSVFANTNM